MDQPQRDVVLSRRRPRPPLLKEQAFTAVRHLILEGSLAPGTFVSEGELAEALGMSKTPIRSALERLAELGFVSISPQRGIIVRELSIREVNEHYDIRMALESFVLRHVAGRLSDAQRAQLGDNIAAQQAAVEAGDISAYTEADGNFHLLFCEFLDNEQILRVMRHQRDKLSLVVQRIHRREPQRMRLSTHEHQEILQAVEGGDGELAASRLISHLAGGKHWHLPPPAPALSSGTYTPTLKSDGLLGRSQAIYQARSMIVDDPTAQTRPPRGQPANRASQTKRAAGPPSRGVRHQPPTAPSSG